ncbi:hypothetical protein AYI69_g5760, partial [Smittium culicis]
MIINGLIVLKIENIGVATIHALAGLFISYFCRYFNYSGISWSTISFNTFTSFGLWNKYMVDFIIAIVIENIGVAIVHVLAGLFAYSFRRYFNYSGISWSTISFNTFTSFGLWNKYFLYNSIAIAVENIGAAIIHILAGLIYHSFCRYFNCSGISWRNYSFNTYNICRFWNKYMLDFFIAIVIENIGVAIIHVLAGLFAYSFRRYFNYSG